MSLFDTLKNQAAQAAEQVGIHTGSQSQTWSVTFQSLPLSLEQMKALPEASLTQPQYTAALTVAALCVYPVNQQAAIEMLNYLKGPEPLSTYEKQFLAERFRGQEYLPGSYFQGATPQNDYTPSQPYTVVITQNQYSTNEYSQGYLTLWLSSGGADSPRQVRLRTKPSTGQWFLVEQMLMVGIRPPVSQDPWA